MDQSAPFFIVIPEIDFIGRPPGASIHIYSGYLRGGGVGIGWTL